jgi:hypothetical protein
MPKLIINIWLTMIKILLTNIFYILMQIIYSVYGYGMSQYLPQGGFKWNNKKWTEEKILELKDDDKVGYLFEVDLHLCFSSS